VAGPSLTEKQPTRDFWSELLSQFDIRTYRTTWSIFSQAYALFGQAAEIFKVKAFASVGLLCRSTVEATCYVYLTRRKEGSLLTFDPPLTLDGKVRKVNTQELRSAIKKTGVLTDGQLLNLDRITTHGDLVAHLAEKTDRVVMTQFETGKNPDPNQMLIWLDEAHAIEDLVGSLSAGYRSTTS
jgi:hypothetical protein